MSPARPGRDMPGKTTLRWRLSWRSLLFLTGLLPAAYLLWRFVVPHPAVLAITVVDATTGQALPGAHVKLQGRSGTLFPATTTDSTGHAHFRDLPAHTDLRLVVQKADYDLVVESQVAMPAGGQTQLTLPLTPDAGGRLFVGLEDARIVPIDTASLLPLPIAALPAESGPVTHLLPHPKQGWLYAIAGLKGFLLDSHTGATLAPLEIEPPHGLTGPTPAGLIQTWGLSGDGQRLLVLDFAARRVLTLEASSGQRVASLSLCRVRSASGEVQLLPQAQGGHLRIARFSSEARTIVPLDVLVDQSPPCLDLWYDEHAFLSQDGRVLYTWLQPAHAGGAERTQEELRIRPIELSSTYWVTRSLPTGISAMATAPVLEELYVLNGTLNTLAILSPWDESRQLLVPVGKEPVAIAVGAGGTRAYVANRQSATISVVDLASARVVHTIPLPGRPLALALCARGDLNGPTDAR